MAVPVVDGAAVRALRAGFSGEVLVPGEAGYERARRWAHDIRADLRPWATGDVYLNFIGDEGHDRLVAGFGRGNYHRLAAVKAAYDPDNVFRLNHNIEPR